jgi:hypothetical protein
VFVVLGRGREPGSGGLQGLELQAVLPPPHPLFDPHPSDTPMTGPRSSDLTLAGGAAALSRNLSAAARRQLDSGWHTLPWRARQSVIDLATVQGLAAVLMGSDAVTFLRYVCVRGGGGDGWWWWLRRMSWVELLTGAG